MIVGHEPAVAALRTHLPPVTLLTGPPSIGKQTIADHLAEHYRIPPVDRLRLTGPLTIVHARGLTGFASTAPFGTFKYATIPLDGASEPALNALLKLLEEPPPTARFMLLATTPVLATIVSRAAVFPLGLLTVEEITRILTQQGATPGAAHRAAQTAAGQVTTAGHPIDDAPRTTAVTVLRAVLAGDQPEFERAVRGGITDDSRQLLRVLLIEAITGRHHTFTPADLPSGVASQHRRLRAMLTTLGLLDGAGARIGVRAALEPFLTS